MKITSIHALGTVAVLVLSLSACGDEGSPYGSVPVGVVNGVPIIDAPASKTGRTDGRAFRGMLEWLELRGRGEISRGMVEAAARRFDQNGDEILSGPEWFHEGQDHGLERLALKCCDVNADGRVQIGEIVALVDAVDSNGDGKASQAEVKIAAFGE